MKILKIILVILAVFIAGLFWASTSNPYWRYSQTRIKWTNQAITDISSWTHDTNWSRAEIANMASANNRRRESDAWLSEKIILMKNGEWMAYKSICRKQDFRVYDLFIGKASNGRWYYSTYHFCMNMITLSMDYKGQPESVAQFAQAYHVKEFDGTSWKCLENTKPPKRKTGGKDP